MESQMEKKKNNIYVYIYLFICLFDVWLENIPFNIDTCRKESSTELWILWFLVFDETNEFL